MAYHLWLYRRQPPYDGIAVAPVLRTGLRVQAIVLGLYALAMLLAPVPATAFWPWPIDEFHSQLYSAAFFAPAVGALVLAQNAAPVELLTVGLTQAVLGLCSMVGVATVDAALHRVDWSQPGPWVWLAGWAVLLVAGAGMVWQAWDAGRPGPTHALRSLG
jgi:hypothetical protein